MNILGIIAFGKNPAACLLRDGKLIAFAAEERFTRLKGSHDMFPEKAVTYCLAEAGIPLEGVDRIGFAWNAKKYPWTMFRNFSWNFLKYKPRERKAFHAGGDSSAMYTAVGELLSYAPSGLRGKIYEGLRAAGLSGRFPPVEFVSHHMAHAYSTYFCSKFERAGILTLDGSGEDICSQLALAEGDQIRVIDSAPIPHSLGWFYAAITQYLGFIPYRDEGKLMGLAALGEERRGSNKWSEPLSKIIKVQPGSYEVDPIYTKFGGHFYANRYTDALVDLLTKVDSDAVPVSYGDKVEIDGRMQSKYLLPLYVDIAWAAQELLERAAVSLAKKLVRDYGVKNLCVAGGVGLNCKMNGEILRQSGAENIFVQPASSDDGSALGAAMYVAHQLGENVRAPLTNVYYGPGFDNDEIRNALDNCKVSYRSSSNPAEDAAELLAQGKIVGWFQERMEFGARALGARSILANPAIPEMKDKVNAEVKYRESWRPFCPSMIESASDEYLVDANEASFMIVAYEGTPYLKQHLPAVVHVDDTVRPQLVSDRTSPRYHSLISEVGKRTGHPVVMNTSFTVRGEPIVCTPLEAVRCFYSNGLDALMIGDFVLQK